jgi:type II secretory pathway component PulC
MPFFLALNASANSDSDNSFKNTPDTDLHITASADTPPPKSNAAGVGQENPGDLELHGVFIYEDTKIAYISVGNAEQRGIVEGQKVMDCCYLHAVFRDRIVIRDNQRDILFRLSTTSVEELVTNSVLPYRPPPALPAHASAEFLQFEGVKRIQPNYHQIERALLKREIESGQIFSQMNILPEEGGGFFIDRIKEGSLSEAIGLHVGDTIQKINNKPLKSVFDAVDMFGRIDSTDSLEIQIKRSGDTQYLYYKLQ